MTLTRGFVILLLAASTACTKMMPPSQAPVEPAAVTQSSNVAGEWTLTVESPMGRDDVRAQFEQAGEQLSGTVISEGREIPVVGTVRGNSVRFGISLDVRGQPLQLDYVGTIEGDNMSGTVQFGPVGNGKFSGRRGAAPTE
jgi:hypothetical protein